MAARTAQNRDWANTDMALEEAEIRRKMSDIADWLKAQSEPPVVPFPKLRAVPSQPESQLSQPEPEQQSDALREVIGRFAGPILADDGERHHPLRTAIAEIVERQRHLESIPVDEPLPELELDVETPEVEEIPVLAEPEPQPEPAIEARDPVIDMERAFERLALQFEERASQSFSSLEERASQSFISLEASVAEVHRLIQEVQSPAEIVEAAEAAATRLVESKFQDISAETHTRIDDVARDLAELRADSTESERRTLDLLNAVRTTLEHVAARLPERAIATAEPAPPAITLDPEDTPSARVRAAARRAIEESAEAEARELAAKVSTPPQRRSFIAAARRSAKSADEPLALTAKYRAPAAPAARTMVTPDHSRNAMKRGMLAGAAVAALLGGVYAGTSELLDGMFSTSDVAELSQSATAPAMAPVAQRAEAVAVPAPAVPAALDLAPTAPQTAAAALPLDLETTASIPQALPAIEALPAEVGGPKLRTRAEMGDAAAQYEVGMRFAEGRNVARDPAQAAIWLQRAAQQGLAPAIYRLGSMTENGTGVTKDLDGARRLYEQAASAGNIQAMHNLGVLHAEGGLGQPDMATALSWFRKAAEYGVRDSQYNLGIFYAKGLAVTQDLTQSYVWFSLAAAQGDRDAGAKRDQIAAKLTAEKLDAAKISIAKWAPMTAPSEANMVQAPKEGWDDAQASRAPAAPANRAAN